MSSLLMGEKEIVDNDIKMIYPTRVALSIKSNETMIGHTAINARRTT